MRVKEKKERKEWEGQERGEGEGREEGGRRSLRESITSESEVVVLLSEESAKVTKDESRRRRLTRFPVNFHLTP